MLYRAVVLTWAVGWTIDRLYEAGADETVDLLGSQLATPQAGAVLAAVGCTTVSLALLVQVRGGAGAGFTRGWVDCRHVAGWAGRTVRSCFNYGARVL